MTCSDRLPPRFVALFSSAGHADFREHALDRSRAEVRRAPTFSLIVIGTLALAVGATAAVGSLLNAVVLRTLAVPNPEQLVALSALEPRANLEGHFYADTLESYRAAQRSFSQMSMYADGGLLRVEARSGVFDNAAMEAVSPSYVDLVGARLSVASVSCRSERRPPPPVVRGPHRCGMSPFATVAAAESQGEIRMTLLRQERERTGGVRVPSNTPQVNDWIVIGLR